MRPGENRGADEVEHARVSSQTLEEAAAFQSAEGAIRTAEAASSCVLRAGGELHICDRTIFPGCQHKP